MRPAPFWITLDHGEPSANLQAFIRDVSPWGVLLFARHLKDRVQVTELADCIHSAVPGWRPRLALDQEGGRVNRLAALGLDFPSAADLDGSPSRAGEVAEEMGGQLATLGFDVDFAPVADLGPAFPGTGLEGRLYGSDPGTVTACCAAFLSGLRRAGMDGCLKHFPGLGGSRVDSHKGLPFVAGGEEERRPHLEPYRALSGAVPYVMVAHGAYASLGQRKPSTLDPHTYALLAETGFAGMSVTDDLMMGALSGFGDLHDLALGAFKAGASLALWTCSQEETLRTASRLMDAPEVLTRRAALPLNGV